MTGPQLKSWRLSEDLSLREVSELLNGDPTVSTLSRWENSNEEIPSLVSDRLLNSTKITLPLGELHQILDYCRDAQQPFQAVLAQALREHLARQQKATAFASTAAASVLNEEPPQPGVVPTPAPEHKSVNYKEVMKKPRKSQSPPIQEE